MSKLTDKEIEDNFAREMLLESFAVINKIVNRLKTLETASKNLNSRITQLETSNKR